MSRVLSVIVFCLVIVCFTWLKLAGAIMTWNWWQALMPARITSGSFFGILLALGVAALLHGIIFK